jgi:hypothetical protein
MRITATVLATALVASLGVMMTRSTAQLPLPAVEPVPGPFALTVGKHYEIYMPDRRPWPSESTLVFVLKTYPNGWADIRTPENQLASINVNQVMQVYRIDDVATWKKLRGKS